MPATAVTNNNMRNHKAFYDMWTRNWQANWPRVAALNGVRRWFHQFKNVPAIICSAGPSLESILPELLEHQGKFMVIAVDAALDRCRKFGVEPDLTVTTDPQPAVADFFGSYHPRHDLVALCPHQDPGVVGLFEPGDIMCYTELSDPNGLTFKYFWDRVHHTYFRGQPHWFGQLAPGGTVTATATSLALAMGCPVVAHVGLDLCFEPGYKPTPGQEIIEHENMAGATVKTLPIFAQSVMWQNNVARVHSAQAVIINATGAGLLHGEHIIVKDFSDVASFHAGPAINHKFQLRKKLRKV